MTPQRQNKRVQFGQLASRLLPQLETALSPEQTKPEDKRCQLSNAAEPSGIEIRPRNKPLATQWQRKWLDLEVTHPDVQIVATAVSAFCGRWFRDEFRKRLMVISGNSGCGKTHIARRVGGWAQAVAFQRFIDQRSSSAGAVPEVKFSEFNEVANAESMIEKEFLGWLVDVNTASMLVLDDIGAETDRFKTGIPAARLCQILNRRAGKFTLITTNLNPDKCAEMWDARVEDRLNRDSLVLLMQTPSFINYS